MKAFILAAGLGTRLAPLTDDRPKALVEVGGITMLERLIVKLKKIGITNILVNVHHHSALVLDFLKTNEKQWEGINIEISNESGKLLDTGGAIKKASSFFDGDENILIHNVDVVSEVDFSELQKYHRKNNNLVSLCVRERVSSRSLLFDAQNKLCGWTNNKTSEFKWVKQETESFIRKAYSGVYLASPEFAKKIPFEGSFSIIDTWLKMAETENISAFDETTQNWFDLGSIDKIKTAETYLKETEQSQKFLERVAGELKMLTQVELIKTVVILPNKRSVIFLKRYFNKGRVNPIWLPDFLSIDEFMESLSGMSKADPLSLYFDLYEIHKKHEGSNAKTSENFLTWAPMIIRDFNDIDLYLSNASDVLKHVSEARAMKEWNLDGQELTSLQKSYIKFYQSLYGYYEELKAKMLKNSNAYSGFVYRYNAENIESLSRNSKWENYVFVGFNALSPSEEKVFAYIKDNFKTSIFFDADEYYIKKHALLPLQEAGINLNKLIRKWRLNDFNWLTSGLMNGKKEINIYDIQGQVGQVKLAGNLLLEKLQHKDENINIAEETAIVLADENLLLPLLSSLPVNDHVGNNNISYNITLGYPINYSPLRGLIYDWFEVLINRQNNSNRQFRTQSISNLVFNNILMTGISAKDRNQLKLLVAKLVDNNIAYVDFGELSKLYIAFNETLRNLLDLLFSEVNSVNSLLNKLIDLLLFLGQFKGNTKNARVSILNEQLGLVLKFCKRLTITLNSNKEDLDLKTFSILFFQLLSSYEISLKGEPLSGVQIMGMLETRALDFKNLIILSANEGILPKPGIPDSFIPFDIRNAFNLPLPKDKNTVLSYHFFRLLQFAENIDIIYDSSSSGLGVGEPSRFLKQIELELCGLNKNINLKKTSLTFASSNNVKPIRIEKNKEILKVLTEKAKSGFSPSALNTYISCKLKFYFQYVLKLNKEKEIEASVESNTFGSIVHDTLEEIYSPFKGKLIDTKILKSKLSNLDSLLSKYFLKHYKTKNISQGKNLLIWEVSKKYVQNFVHSEIAELKDKQRKIRNLEQNISLEINTGTSQVLLKGIIDRIDSDAFDKSIRIIDYKTGKVEAKDLKPKDINLLATDNKYSKAFQVLFYKYLYLDTLELDGNEIETGIISLRNLSAGFLKIQLKTENLMEEFEGLLFSIIDEIFDSECDFEQTDNADACTYCDYKNICNR